MTPERWEKVRDVLGQVLELAPEKRSQYLDGACANDSPLRDEVESLLSSDESARSSFLQSPPIPPAALTKGTRLGDYEIISLVGSGGMGEVYRARDTKLKREVAIKVLPAYWSRDPERLERFELEARAAAVLNHPNITSIFHVGQHDGSPYIVTELLHGETLRERLRKGPIRLHEALDYCAEIARGLGAAHDAGVIHRDLKPENIFVTKDGRIKILDFGLAKLQVPKFARPEDPTVIPRHTNPGQVLGTVGYMSPEQVRGNSTDARSDIFAAGDVLYEMLTGKPPFRKATSAETMSAILNEDPPTISQVAPNLPPGLQRIVNRCLAKNPEQRFQHASDLAFALEALSDSGSSSSIDATVDASSKRWLWVAAAVAFIAVVAAVYFWLTRPPAAPVVEAITQLSDDGAPKSGTLLTDGSRIFFSEGSKVVQVSASGGETSVVPTSLNNPVLAGIAADGSYLLSYTVDSPIAQPLWTIPLPTGEPRRFGAVESQPRTGYFPDGRVVFGNGTDLYVAERDGSNSRKLLTASSLVACPRVSPDGKQIVFVTYSLPGYTIDAIDQAAADGSGVHEILRSTQGSPVSCASWTADSEHLIYRVMHAGRSNIWALSAHTGFLRRNSTPVQLTNGPLSYETEVPSRDGNRIFAIGRRNRGELVRFDMSTKQFVPFLGGISAIEPTFSRDGQWVVYTLYADHTLWRSRADGTQRQQLTYPPIQVSFPLISPDGKYVSFITADGESYVLSLDGGPPKRVDLNSSVSTCASPTENAIVFTAIRPATNPGEKAGYNLRMLDPHSGALCLVPSSKGIFGGLWIGQGKLVAATDDYSKFLMFDFNSGSWTDLVSGSFVNWWPSPDGKYLYYVTGGDDPRAMRIRLADRKVETITSLKYLHRVIDEVDGTQIGVAPDGSPVFTRDIGTQEIYALTVKWP